MDLLWRSLCVFECAHHTLQESNGSGQKVVTTQFWPSLLKQWKLAGSNEGVTNAARNAHQVQVRKFLSKGLKVLGKCGSSVQQKDILSGDTALLFSCAVLMESIYYKSIDFQVSSAEAVIGGLFKLLESGNQNHMSCAPFLDAMLRANHWCPVKIQSFHECNSLAYFLGALSPSNDEDHSICSPPSCVADQINEITYQSRHIPEC